jgi:hypothetical protein
MSIMIHKLWQAGSKWLNAGYTKRPQQLDLPLEY